MSGSKKQVIYWDANIFLAWLNREPHAKVVDDGILEHIEKLRKKELHLATSVVTLIEILQSKTPAVAREEFQRLFQLREFHLVNVDRRIAFLAQEIRDYYQENRLPSDGKLMSLSTPDAIHVASAIARRCERFYTFDAKSQPSRGRAPLTLVSPIAGKYPLIITKPEAQQLTLFNADFDSEIG